MTIASVTGLAASAAAAIQQRLGYQFSQPTLLRDALTHSSATASRRTKRQSNERLEFLGDRVLGLVMAERLYRRFDRDGEGALSKRHAGLVCRETLAEVAAELGLADWLILARGEEETGGRTKAALLADGVEAVIGAIYLDGGMGPAAAFIEHHWAERIERMQAPPRDPKTTLQEWTQARGLGLPDYRVTATSGPDHAPSFEVTVTCADLGAEVARAGSKRAAEQAAAAQLLARFELAAVADG